MNYRLVARFLGHFTLAVSLFMLPSVGWAVYYGEWTAVVAFFESMAVGGSFGLLLVLAGRRAPIQMYQREGLALVGLGWLLAAAVGALPFIFGKVLGPVDAFFESMSGFTTAGSTVLTNIEVVDKGILFWRSFTHWLGGMGIIVLFVAVLPYLGVGGKQLFKSESTGPDPRGLSPHIKDTASMLWKIYLIFTVAQTVCLMVAGMSLFDSLCHTFGTLASGGFSPYNASVGHFDSIAMEVIIIFFMYAGGVNFALYFAMLRGSHSTLFRNSEWRIYTLILVVAVLLVTVNLLGFQGHVGAEDSASEGLGYTPGHALRVAAFNVISIMTTTGFCTDDFDQWPQFSRMLLVLLMCIGGSAGSTAGGVKVIRLILVMKLIYYRVEASFRPKRVVSIRVGDQIVEDSILRNVLLYVCLYVAIVIAATGAMALVGLPLQSALTSVTATLNTTGPGLELVGAVRNYAFIPDIGKLILTLCMVLGRLELYTICVLFLPGFWRHA